MLIEEAEKEDRKVSVTQIGIGDNKKNRSTFLGIIGDKPQPEFEEIVKAVIKNGEFWENAKKDDLVVDIDNKKVYAEPGLQAVLGKSLGKIEKDLKCLEKVSPDKTY